MPFRRLPFLARVALSCLLLATAFTVAQEKVVAPLRTMDLKPETSIVFLGDSITHQCLYTQYVEDYLYTRFPNKRFKIHNAGVGGARASDALARFEK